MEEKRQPVNFKSKRPAKNFPSRGVLMVNAEWNRQLMISVPNTVGSLAEVTSAISVSGINLIALCAYATGNMVAIMFVTEDNNAARKLLEDQGCQVREEEVILLSVDNKPGALQAITDKIAEAGIDLKLIYGSVDKDSKTSRLVLIAENNLDTMMVIRTQVERG